MNSCGSDSSNAILWVNSCDASPWNFQFYSNEIKSILVSMKASFYHISLSADGMTDILAKQGVDRETAFVNVCSLGYNSSIPFFLGAFGLFVSPMYGSPF